MVKVLCLEGIPGSGKTTQVRKLGSWFESQGFRYRALDEETAYEPFRAAVSDWKARSRDGRFTLDDIRTLAVARAETHQRNFVPLLGSLDYLIFDRGIYTSAVFQSSDQIPPEQIVTINKEQDIIVPDRCFMLLCDPVLARQRIDDRRRRGGMYTQAAAHESIEEIGRVKRIYEVIASQNQEVVLINADKSEDEVFRDILANLGGDHG